MEGNCPLKFFSRSITMSSQPKYFGGKLFGRTVPPNNTLFGGTVPPNSTLFSGTPDFDKEYIFLLSMNWS